MSTRRDAGLASRWASPLGPDYQNSEDGHGGSCRCPAPHHVAATKPVAGPGLLRCWRCKGAQRGKPHMATRGRVDWSIDTRLSAWRGDTLQCWPIPAGPTREMLEPKVCSRGMTNSASGASPPTKTDSVLFLAPRSPPTEPPPRGACACVCLCAWLCDSARVWQGAGAHGGLFSKQSVYTPTYMYCMVWYGCAVVAGTRFRDEGVRRCRHLVLWSCVWKRWDQYLSRGSPVSACPAGWRWRVSLSQGQHRRWSCR